MSDLLQAFVDMPTVCQVCCFTLVNIANARLIFCNFILFYDKFLSNPNPLSLIDIGSPSDSKLEIHLFID